MADLSSLAPFGVGVVALGAIVFVLRSPKEVPVWLITTALCFVALIYFVEKLIAPGTLLPKGSDRAAEQIKSDQSTVNWVDTGSFADWGGRDYAYTKGETPIYSVNDSVLCDERHVGFIAICWGDRPSGYPPNVATLRNFTVPPDEAKWCTYKDKSVNILTPPDGKAAPGRVYQCARVVNR